MKITENVILDLMPLYLADEASADTRLLVETYLGQNEALARRVRESQGQIPPGPGVRIPPELELRSLRRTRMRIRRQRWLFGLGCFFTALCLSRQFTVDQGQITRFRLLVLEWPAAGVACLTLAVGCWVAYGLLGRKLRAARA